MFSESDMRSAFEKMNTENQAKWIKHENTIDDILSIAPDHRRDLDEWLEYAEELNLNLVLDKQVKEEVEEKYRNKKFKLKSLQTLQKEKNELLKLKDEQIEICISEIKKEKAKFLKSQDNINNIKIYEESIKTLKEEKEEITVLYDKYIKEKESNVLEGGRKKSKRKTKKSKRKTKKSKRKTKKSKRKTKKYMN